MNEESFIDVKKRVEARLKSVFDDDSNHKHNEEDISWVI